MQRSSWPLSVFFPIEISHSCACWNVSSGAQSLSLPRTKRWLGGKQLGFITRGIYLDTVMHGVDSCSENRPETKVVVYLEILISIPTTLHIDILKIEYLWQQCLQLNALIISLHPLKSNNSNDLRWVVVAHEYLLTVTNLPDNITFRITVSGMAPTLM